MVARVVTSEKVTEFEWSSLPLFLGKDRPEVLEGKTVLRESGGLSDTRVGWLQMGEPASVSQFVRRPRDEREHLPPA